MVIFDMAGTTIDEDNLVYKCIRKALEKHKFITDLETILYYCAGKEKLDAIKTVLHEIYPEPVSDDLILSIYQTFRELLEEAYDIAPLSLFSGAETVFTYLRDANIKVVFNTGYDNPTAMKILHKVNCLPGSSIDALVTADMVANARPAPDMIQYALQLYDVTALECIKIGDSITDIEEGKNAGVKFNIGITTGAQTFEMLQQAQPDEILDDLVDLIPVIQQLNAER
jgi:phosphonatase-like hydrolase